MINNSHQEKVKEFHDYDANQYEKNRYHSDSCEGLSYLTRKDLVLDAVDISSGKVLDIGCGPGIITTELLNKNLIVFNTDISAEMLKESRHSVRELQNSENAFFVVSDATQICCVDKAMDMVLCVGVVCYIEDYNKLLDEINRVLNVGGKSIIQIDYIRFPKLYSGLVPLYQYVKSKLTSKNYDKLNFKFNYFSYKEFIEALKSRGFHVLSVDHFDFRIPFVDVLFPRFSLWLGRFMFKYRESVLLRNFSYGLLIKSQKTV